MQNLLTWLSRHRFPYEPLIKVEISRSRLIHNLNEFRKLAPGGRIAPVLKSNAYGHGLLEVAQILEGVRYSSIAIATSTPFFIVDSYFEAVALRARGIKTPLLIIGYTRPETILNSKLSEVSYAITSLETLQSISQTDRRVSIQIKIDTGMHRQGLLPNEIDAAIDHIKGNDKISLKGVCSHLSDVDNSDPAFTLQQIKVWNGTVAKLRASLPSIEYIHLSATDGHKYSTEIEANLSRLGLGLYGISPKFAPMLALEPVMQIKTIITGIKKLERGQTIGYSNTFKAEKEMVVATIPVGYFEGLDRRLSNKGAVIVGQEQSICPIIGKVSMNITSIDISNLKSVKIGDEVTVISNKPTDINSIPSIAKLCDTFEYEIAIHIPEHLKRVVTE